MAEKKYKVIALSVGGRGNKIYHLGDTVTDKNFIDERAEELEKKGFLKLIEGGDDTLKSSQKTPQAISNTSDEGDGNSSQSTDDSNLDNQEGNDVLNTLQSSLNAEEEEEEEDPEDQIFNEITREELKASLTQKNIPFKSNATKKELYELWKK